MSNFTSILSISAASAEQLRPIDVDRVMLEAHECNVLDDFRSWLLTQELMPRTRLAVSSFQILNHLDHWPQ